MQQRKHVLITGGSRGIGAATARKFAQCGWDVTINYCTSHKQAELLVSDLLSMGVQAQAIQTDLSDEPQASVLIQQTQQTLGPIFSLVCNAGIALPQMLLTDVQSTQWNQLLSTNLSGLFYLLRAAVPHFVKQQKGSIVTVSSMWGVSGGSCEAAYSASKAGVIGLTQAMAKELGPSHIRVNCVAPGVIATDMNAHLTAEDLLALSDETPLCRIGQPEEVAEGIYFLASDAASFITGQTLQINGGIFI